MRWAAKNSNMNSNGPSRLDELDDEGQARPSATGAFKDGLRQVEQLKEFVAYYGSARWDALKASLRNTMLKAAVVVAGLFALGGILVAAGVLLMTGLADGLSRLLNTGPWAGNLLAGTIILAILGIALAVGMKALRRRWRQQLEQKYDERRLQERIKYGQDVGDYAARDQSH